MRQTPLRDLHAARGARFVDFFGWEMPVQYAGILEETQGVRQHVGLFDLCHMGRLVVEGPDRDALVDKVFSARFQTLKTGRAKYGFLLNEGGYPVDDVLVYRDAQRNHIVINATGREKDLAHIQSHTAGMDATVEEVSEAQAMLALQGPASMHVLQPLCEADLSAVRYYGFTTARVCGHETLLARTGYTGEDGFELFFDPAHAVEVWEALEASGRALDIQPVGLGARDILRLEAGMPLYGQEITPEIGPLEAGLGFGVDLAKTDTVGVAAVAARKAAGLTRKAVSLAREGGRVARAGCDVVDEAGQVIGTVTSGGVSPTVGKHIARALIPAAMADAGGEVRIDIRGRAQPMTIVPSPFYTRPR